MKVQFCLSTTSFFARIRCMVVDAKIGRQSPSRGLGLLDILNKKNIRKIGVTIGYQALNGVIDHHI